MKITRGITKEFANMLMNSELYELYQKHQDELFIGVRNNYVNIYYKSASICKVVSNTKGELLCEVANKYIGKEPEYKGGESKKRVAYSKLHGDDIVDMYSDIKKNINTFHLINEKTAQQQLIYKNNSNPESKWFCIDIEYVKQRNNRSEKTFGRFDIIAVSKIAPHKVALIELKYGAKSIGGDSGVVKHVQDYLAFIENKIFENHLKSEVGDMIKSLNLLGICPDPLKGELDICVVPEFYFITLDNENDTARQTMRRYVLDNVNGASTRTVQKICGIDITQPNARGFTPVFLFSTDTIDNIGKGDIIEDERYVRGLD